MPLRLVLIAAAALIAAAPVLSGADGGCGYSSVSVVDGGAGEGDLACGDAGADSLSLRNSENDWLEMHVGVGGAACGALGDPGWCPEGSFRLDVSPAIQNGETFDLGCDGIGLWACPPVGEEPEGGTIRISDRGECIAIELHATFDGVPFDRTFLAADCGECGGTGKACDHDSECCTFLCDNHLCAP